MSKFIDDEGNVHNEGFLGGSWNKEQGVFGTNKDVNWLGQPNLERDFLGRPVQARTAFGSPIHSDEGQPLYKSSSPTDISSGGSDALAGLAAIGLLVLGVLIIGAIFALLAKITSSLVEGYQTLMRRYPWPMRIFHLALGMLLVYAILFMVGFSMELRLLGVALVPALWGWIRLTRKLPMVFMPINAVLIGAGLWFVAQYTRPIWQSNWSRLTTGLPIVDNLPILLAVLPMTIWLWTLGSRRWPWLFYPLAQLFLGGLLWFFLMRVWTDWQPYWNNWMEPVPLFILFVGWIILFLPLFLWLRKRGQERWPLPFVLNLLILGAVLGLSAYHTQPSWQAIWNQWMVGMPFFAAPILVISLMPISFWSWSWATNRWRRYFIIPNLLISGFIIWLILDRTRPLWTNYWDLLWGAVPFSLDPAIVIPLLPLAIWGWKRASQQWPQYWEIARAILWGGILWWLAERIRIYWESGWQSFAGPNFLDLAIILALVPLTIWGWTHLRRRWPKIFFPLSWIILTGLIYWFISHLLPQSSLLFRLAVAFFPISVRGWLWLINRNWIAGCSLALIPVAILVCWVFFFPESVDNFLNEGLFLLFGQPP
jgi:hypothetical protein